MKGSVLLIGGAGYIGTVVTEYLLSKNYKVHCLDNFIYNETQQILAFLNNKNYTFKYHDLTCQSNIKSIVNGFDCIVMLAGLVGDPITKKYIKESEEVNFKGINNFILNLRDNFKGKFIFVSTCSNYGVIPDGDMADENYPLNPLSHYAKCKVLIEELITNMKNKVDFTATILRFSTAYGLSPRMRFDLTVNEFARDLYFNKKLEVYDPDTWRPYCHTRDFARIIELVLKAEKNKVDF